MGKRNYNYSMLRFWAAAMVIFAHAFVLSVQEGQQLSAFESGFSNFCNVPLWGSAAVGVFFWGSGFFLSMVCERNESFLIFMKKRLIRVMPMLMIVAILSACVLGPIVSSLSTGQYFSSATTWKYLLNGVFVLQHNLPGVFEGNAYTSTVNGALWTMPVEVLCYVLCYIYYKINKNTKSKLNYVFLALSVLAAVGAIFLSARLGLIYAAIRAIFNFWCGMQCYIFRDKIIPIFEKKSWINLVLVVLVIGLFFLDYTMEFAMLFGTSLIMLVVLFGSKQHFQKVEFLGNSSYCMYLIGFPIQQTVIYLFGGHMSPMLNIAIALVLDVLLAIALFYLVEKPISDRLFSKKK